MRILVYSHLYIAFCAVAMTTETIVLFNINLRERVPYLSMVFFATLVAYNFKGIRSLFFEKKIADSDKKKWAIQNKFILLGIGLTSFIIVITVFFFVRKNAFLWLIPLGLLSLGYSYPIVIGKNRIAIRELPFIKTFLVALVWTIVVGYIPFAVSGLPVNKFWVLIEFLFLFSLAVLFDIKDIHSDHSNNIKTVPLAIGIGGTKILSITILSIRMGLVYFLMHFTKLFVSELVITLISIICISKYVKKETPEFFYMTWIDGLMLLKFLVSVLFVWTGI
jgi:4-hydroxybenzoate polyprenyltransferase